ncbi:GDSL-type esterase/lipase family protein [Capillimicrobium parvum]|nr:GDSL-type esterase/lipase family protein [Capillimicrobium parvum]
MPPRRLLLLAAAALAVVALRALDAGAAPASGAAAVPAACTGARWVASWLASPSDAAGGAFKAQTLRTIVTPHLGGGVLRLRLSNRFGTQSVTFDRVTVGRRLAGAAVVPGTLRTVTFGGSPSVSVSGGQEAVSDPVALTFNAFDDLAVSIWFADSTGPATEHFIGRQTSYATLEDRGEDRTGDASADGFTALSSTAKYFVTGLDVAAPASTGAVVAFGDSLTDGYEGSPSPLLPNLEPLDANGAYPDVLQRRVLLSIPPPGLAILNAGITGNRILDDGLIDQHGPKAIERLQPDALDRAGVTDVLILEGTNDLGARSAGAEQVIGGLRILIQQARSAGKGVLLGTLTPSGGAEPTTYGDGDFETQRQQVNFWIRTAGEADAVVDFDAALRDPGDPARLRAAFDSGDHLHPNLAGYRAMADAVALEQLRGTGCPAPPTAAERKRCRATAAIRVPKRWRAGMRRAVVTVDGRRAGVIRRPGGRVRVSLRGRRGATVTVKVRVERSGRGAVAQTRRFARCARVGRATGR